MNKVLIVLICIVAFFGFVALTYFAIYNGLVSANIEVDNTWSQVRVQLQRRHDLIPNIVEATKDYMAFEQGLLTNITQARSAWTSAVNSGDLESQMTAGNQLGEVTGQFLLVATVENYPELSSQEVVLTMIDELAGTENRISYRRELYNTAVADYNKAVQSFPSNIVASMSGFREKPYYMGSEGIDEVPTVDLTGNYILTTNCTGGWVN